MSDKASAQTEDPNSEITVSFTLDEVDCRNAVTAIVKQENDASAPMSPRQRLLKRLVLLIILALIIFASINYRDYYYNDSKDLGILLACAVTVGVLWLNLFWSTFPHRITKDDINKCMNSIAIEQNIGSWQVSLTAAGVNFISPDSSEQRTWRSISHFSSLGEFVIIAFHIRPEVLIPCRAFENHTAAERFIRSGNARLAASGENVERRVIRWLSRHDLPCPKCTYNLHGVTELKCPECGHVLEKKEYPNAFRHQDAAYLKP